MTKIKWYDWLIYRIFHQRWNKIYANRPDLREIVIASLKAYDTIDSSSKYKINVSISEIK